MVSIDSRFPIARSEAAGQGYNTVGYVIDGAIVMVGGGGYGDKVIGNETFKPFDTAADEGQAE
jgi:hypothetical protein